MAKEPDMRILIGVAKGGPAGDSEALIRKELTAILKKIKAEVQIDTKFLNQQPS